MSLIQKNVSIKNRKASFEYHFLEEFTSGIVLTGSEIKSVRMGKVSLPEAYCYFNGPNELMVKGMNIAPYEMGGYSNHEPLRPRKLLLQKKELKKLHLKLKDKGLTVIVTRMFISEKGWAKLNIALAKGKKLYDKRQDKKEKDAKREIRSF